MKNLSKLSLKKSLSREELRKVRGEGSNCYCQDSSNWGPVFFIPGPCSPSKYPAHFVCQDR